MYNSGSGTSHQAVNRCGTIRPPIEPLGGCACDILSKSVSRRENMIVSFEHASDLLKKWATEKSPVSVVLSTAECGVTFSGYIVDIAPPLLQLAHFCRPDLKASEITVDFRTFSFD